MMEADSVICRFDDLACTPWNILYIGFDEKYMQTHAHTGVDQCIKSKEFMERMTRFSGHTGGERTSFVCVSL
jgi:hypothetical protein